MYCLTSSLSDPVCQGDVETASVFLDVSLYPIKLCLANRTSTSDIETALRKLHEPPPAVQMQWTWCIRNDGSDLLKKPLTRSAAESDEVEADLFPERVVCDEDEQNCWW